MSVLSSYFDRYNLVKQIPIFSKLNWIDLQRIAGVSTIVEYRKGDIVCQKGDPADYLYCVVSGRIQAYADNEEGMKTNVEFMHRGMYFGIISLLTGEGHSLSFEAINDSVVLQIEKEKFHELLESIPRLGMVFSRSLSQRLRKRTSSPKTIFESTIISVYSPTAKSGSSTYAMHLAASLKAEAAKKVIYLNIVSSPSQGSKATSATLQWKKDPLSLARVTADEERILEHVASGGGVAVDRVFVHCDSDPSSLRQQISRFVTAWVNDYHYIIVDLPNEMDDVVLETLTQSDLIHLIALDDPDSIQQTRRVLEQLKGSLNEHFDLDKLHVLISRLRGARPLTPEAVSQELNYPPHAFLEDIDPQQMTATLDAPDLAVHLPEAKTPYAQEVRKIARRIGNVRVGLVLGGGAALGLAHIGVLKVLEEEDIPVDVVVGSSMGALIAALWVAGYSSEHIGTLACEFAKKRNVLKLVDPVFPISGLIGGRAIRRWLKKKIGAMTFYQARIPLKIVAYDLKQRQEMVIDSGPVVDAVQRSIAIPGVIRPVIEGGKVIIDGGVLNPLPTNVLVGQGVKRIIAVNVLQSPEDVTRGVLAARQKERAALQEPFLKNPGRYIVSRFNKGMKNIFSPSISDIIVYSLQASEYVISQESARHADVLIHPDLSGFNWVEFNRSEEFIRKGEVATRQALGAIRELIRS